MVECAITPSILPQAIMPPSRQRRCKGNPEFGIDESRIVVNPSPFVNVSSFRRHKLVIHIVTNTYLARRSIAQERARALHCHDRLGRRDGFVAGCGVGGDGGAGAAGLLHDFDVVGGCGDV
jgi:hypothetical protein